ncbi:MAG: diaminohydroxyphosphoribosylaminopyrimidine deaminase [Pseudomonadota bacterium]
MNAMQMAIDEAWKYQGLTYPNPAVGATVTKQGMICAVAAHKKAGMPHAEVNALKDTFMLLSQNAVAKSALQKLENSSDIHNFLSLYHSDIFKDCELFVTLEPCAHYGKTPPCAALIYKLGIKKVYIGVQDPNKTAAGGIEVLQKAGIKVEISYMKNECENLLLPFRKWLNSKFIFFKIATTLNGGTLGNITGEDSKKEVHKLRSVVDLLITGGESVRNDRPILDSRLANAKAPNLAIYSRQKEFDNTIPCFSVPNRSVILADDLEQAMIDKRFVMIEGGINLLKNSVQFCDAILLFQNSNFSLDSASFELNAKLAHSRSIGNDNMKWLFVI